MVNCCTQYTNLYALNLKLQVYLNSITSCSFQITHNVSLDQSPITTNRPSVTLYGVQLGETYTVEIISLPMHTCMSSAVMIRGQKLMILANDYTTLSQQFLLLI